MKNAMLKFAGLFIERVPVDDPPQGINAPAIHVHQAAAHAPQPLHGHFPPTTQPDHLATPEPSRLPDKPQRPVAPPHQHTPAHTLHAPPTPIAIALRAMVPQEYAGYLAAHGLHVIAAAANLSPAQAKTWGAQVLVLSAECIGTEAALLTHPMIPTVFITTHPVMVAPVPGVIQVTEPLRASEVAEACRQAHAAWTH